MNFKKYYAVIDTNVLVSSFLKHDSKPGKVIDMIYTSDLVPVYNNEILREYNNVLKREKFGFNGEEIDAILGVIHTFGINVDEPVIKYTLPDPDDAVFYEVTMEARKTNDTYLVTGNSKHFPVRTFVVTPAEFMDIVEKDGTPST